MILKVPPNNVTCCFALTSLRALPSHWHLKLHELPLKHRCGVMGHLSGGRVLYCQSDPRRWTVNKLLV